MCSGCKHRLQFRTRHHKPTHANTNNTHDSQENPDSKLYGQTLAAFGTACIQNGAAATGCHTGTESMSALAAYNGRLVSTFHVGLANLAKKIGSNSGSWFDITLDFAGQLQQPKEDSPQPSSHPKSVATINQKAENLRLDSIYPFPVKQIATI